ncbi:MAG TPA: dihydroxyacetone kinase subunit L [Candidatus Limiplasma sp.]|nr:dihydroxyacetone kinase subunit L [Candidatus Limiplasma sp.]HRX09027.1 dihydroxyacetone kinase subunit L [Candidatus Limiplasma sp.]
MLNEATLKSAFLAVSQTMKQNRDYLISLDQRNGDGDLGISMDEGFAAAFQALTLSSEADLGKLLVAAAKAFNEAAPSSLGTILSFMMMGMAKTLKGHETADAALVGEALTAGVEKIMERANSNPGQKTVLDALDPAVKAVCAHAPEGFKAAFAAASEAAKAGAESTKDMKAVHGRAAYYGDKAIGLVDGGAVAGSLLFEALADAASNC